MRYPRHSRLSSIARPGPIIHHHHGRLVKPAGGVAAPFGGHATLGDDIVSWWNLDEESGARIDSHGDNDLTDNNTVLFGAGKIDNAALMVRGLNESLSLLGALTPATESDWTITRFVYLTARLGNDYETYCLDGGGGFYTQVSAGALNLIFGIKGGGGTKTATSVGDFSLNAWHFILTSYNAATNIATVQVDAHAPVTVAAATYTQSGSLWYVGGPSAVHGCSGLWDLQGMWSRILTGGEITDLINGGAGLAY